MIDDRRDLRPFDRCRSRRTDDDVAVAVTVHIPGCAHRVAKVSISLVALGRPGWRWCLRPDAAAVIDIGAPFIRLAVVVVVRADDDISYSRRRSHPRLCPPK